MGTANGIDVSAYQAAQDWAALAKSGIVFAFAKASEGQHTRDPRFAGHISGIIAAGLVPGAYHFAWPNQPAANEAANYIAAVKPYARRGFVHSLDLERRSDGTNYAGATAAEIRAYATAWLAAVKKAFPGQKVGVYTSASDIAAGHYPGNSDFLWYPAYPVGGMTYAQAAARARPAPSGRAPIFWQFTSTPIDRNLAYMTPAALRAWAAGTTPDPEDNMPLTDADVAKVSAAVVKQITAPGARDTLANAVLYWLQRGYDPSIALPTGKDAPSVAGTVAALRPLLAGHDGPQLSDAQVGQLAAALAANGTFAANVAEQLADKLAARLQS